MKGHGSKRAVPRHRVSSDAQERSIERQERQRARVEIRRATQDHAEEVQPAVPKESNMSAAQKQSEMKPVVKLLGNDGNAFAIVGACLKAGRKAGFSPEKLTAIQNEMTSGDYNHLLATAMKHFDVE